MQYFLDGCLLWGGVALLIWAARPAAPFSRETVEMVYGDHCLATVCVAVAVILLCTLPMSLAPIWNGDIPDHRNQYEVMAESILDGRVDLDYGDMDPRLLAMDNPYSPVRRVEEDVFFHHDHALYNGHYYMYFGVVPVFLVFLPFRVMTGASLTTYHATQIFTALFIAGVFALFFLLAKQFFRRMPWTVYLTLSAAVSVMSVWYLSAAPALYCTAISAGICMEIWSLFFFGKAVWDGDGGWKSACMGALGSLFGALAFGCRPTVALANLLAIPLFIRYVKGKRPDGKLFRQILAVLAPYIVIGALLMWYNYIRFDDPFEFGQTYQLTFADQSGYGSLLARLDLNKVVRGLGEAFVVHVPLTDTFPYVTHQSVLFNFPICFVALLCLVPRDTRSLVKKHHLTGLTVGLLLCPILITVFHVLEAPYLLERYRSDIYWLVGIFLFLAFGHFLETLGENGRRICGFGVSLLALITLFQGIILWMVPYDANYTGWFPEKLDEIARVLRLGF